jgi:hypothetical protein
VPTPDKLTPGFWVRTFLNQLAAAYGVVLLVALCLLGELLVFHVLLGYKGMTTYDYIIAERRRKEELLERKLERQVGGGGGSNMSPAEAAEAGQRGKLPLCPPKAPCSRGSVAPSSYSPDGTRPQPKVSLSLCALMVTQKRDTGSSSSLPAHGNPAHQQRHHGSVPPPPPPTTTTMTTTTTYSRSDAGGDPHGGHLRMTTQYVPDAPPTTHTGNMGVPLPPPLTMSSPARAVPDALYADSPTSSPSKRGLFNPQSNPLRSHSGRLLNAEPPAA